jgi:hypothetical protein
MKTGIRTARVSTFTSGLPTVWSPAPVAGYVYSANWAVGTLFQFQFAARKFTLGLGFAQEKSAHRFQPKPPNS